MKKITIYQAKIKTPYCFRCWEEAVNNFDSTDYDEVYWCYRDDDYSLDDAFEEFNIHRPKEFKARSMSVSDVISIDNTDFYYVDDIGFQKIQFKIPVDK